MQTGIPILDGLQFNPISTFFFLVCVIIGLTVHEFAHAAVASRQGDQTARQAGRISLNPLAHLDPAGSFMFLIAGIGWAKPVPVNPYQLKDGKWGDFQVSIAGIVTNLILASIAGICLIIFQWLGIDITPNSSSLVVQFLIQLSFVNCLLAAFNILPIPPLDGSKAIGILVPRFLESTYQKYLQVGPVLLIGLFLISFTLHLNFFGRIIEPMVVVLQYLTTFGFFR
ncbi:site-2 protease family protein [Patescibacteria group bacterium]|nr:site-2 protease family protein [Patescibacteria group bacterium]